MDLGSVWGPAGKGAWMEWRLGGGQAPGSRAPGLSLEPVPTLPWDGPTRLPRHPSPLIDWVTMDWALVFLKLLSTGAKGWAKGTGLFKTC